MASITAETTFYARLIDWVRSPLQGPWPKLSATLITAPSPAGEVSTYSLGEMAVTGAAPPDLLLFLIVTLSFSRPVCLAHLATLCFVLFAVISSAR